MYTKQEKEIASRYASRYMSGGSASMAAATATATEDPIETFKQTLSTIDVDGQTFFVAEGDILLDSDEVIVYAVQRQAQDLQRLVGTVALSPGSGDLLGITVGNKLVRWQVGLTLTYCVLKRSFTSDADYEAVKANMLSATKDWENVCGIKFQHNPELDDSPVTPPPSGVIFSVRQLNSNGNFIASAFFPNDPPERRRVLIDPTYFTTSFDRVGVLRHELGHVIGLRHEHIRSGAPPVCPDESTVDTFPFTDYDPKSVMHYFCGGVGTRELAISDIDKVGILKLYGPPLESFSFVG
jgi:hypothetical protein